MGRRLPRHTVRKSTGERRLPDKTNNARDSSEDGSEEVRAPRQEARRGAWDLFVAVFLSAEGAGARTATSQRQNERPEQQLPDNRGVPHLEQQLEMTKKRGRGRPLGSRKITCTKTPLPQGISRQKDRSFFYTSFSLHFQRTEQSHRKLLRLHCYGSGSKLYL